MSSRAAAAYEECLELHKTLDDPTGVAFALLGLGDIAWRTQRQRPTVEEYCGESLARCRDLGRRVGIGFSLQQPGPGRRYNRRSSPCREADGRRAGSRSAPTGCEAAYPRLMVSSLGQVAWCDLGDFGRAKAVLSRRRCGKVGLETATAS